MSARAVPLEGRLDRGQALAVLRLLLGQGFRAGVDPSSGVRGHPLRQIVVGLVFLGLMFAPNAWRCADLASYLVLLFASTLVLVLIAINPENPEVRDRHAEILGSKPVARRTMFFARGVLLTVLATVMAASFAAAPLLLARLRFGTPYLHLARAAGSLLVGAFVAAVTGLVLVVVAMRWLRPEQVRRVSQTLLGIFFVANAVASLMTSSRAVMGPAAVPAMTLTGGPVEFLPSTWFARLAVGTSGDGHDLQRLAALALIAGAAFMVAGGGLERFLPSFLEPSSAVVAEAAPPVAARVLRRVARVPGLGSWWLPPRPAAIAEAILVQTRREELSRNRALMMHLMALVAVAMGMMDMIPAMMASVICLYVVIGAAAEGVRMGRQSTSPDAGWLFQKAPVTGAEILRGQEAAALVRALGLPLLFLAVLTFRFQPVALAVLLLIGALAMTKIAAGAALAFDPGTPLTREPVAGGGLGEMAVSVGIAWILVSGYATVLLLAGILGRWVIPLVVLADVGLFTAAWLSGVVAAARLDVALRGR